MSTDAIKTIAEIEQQEREKKLLAQKEAAKAINDARENAALAMQNAREQGAAEAAAMLKKAEQTATTEAAELHESTANRCAALAAHAEARFDRAAEVIFRRVVDGA